MGSNRTIGIINTSFTAITCVFLLSACSKTHSENIPAQKPPSVTSNAIRSVNKVEILQPFGGFEWGDDFSTVMSKICGLGGIQTIIVFDIENENEVCGGKHYDFNYFLNNSNANGNKVTSPNEIKSIKNANIANSVGFVSQTEQIDSINLSKQAIVHLTAKPITVQGVDYSAVFTLSDANDNLGAYLKQKNKSVVVATADGVITAPFGLVSVELTPIDFDKAQINAANTFNFLRQSYGSYKSLRADQLTGLSYNNNGVTFSYDMGVEKTINYDGSAYLRSIYLELHNSYQKSAITTQQKNDTYTTASDGSKHQLFPNQMSEPKTDGKISRIYRDKNGNTIMTNNVITDPSYTLVSEHKMSD